MNIRLLLAIPALLAIGNMAVAAESDYDISVRAQPSTRSKSEVLFEVIVTTPSSRGRTVLSLRPDAAPARFNATTNGESGPNGSLARTEMLASLDAKGKTVSYRVETVVGGRVVALKKGSTDVR